MSHRRTRRNKSRNKDRQPEANRNLPLASNAGGRNAFASNTLVASAAVESAYRQAARLAERGDCNQARAAYKSIVSQNAPLRVLALVENDIGTLDAITGEMAAARAQFQR